MRRYTVKETLFGAGSPIILGINLTFKESELLIEKYDTGDVYTNYFTSETTEQDIEIFRRYKGNINSKENFEKFYDKK